VGRRHSIDTHKTKFLRKKQGSDIQSILAPKSARKRHSIDTRNRMSKEATFHRYLQYHSAGRRLLVDTCIFENQKPGFHAKTRLLCQKPGFHAKNQNLASMPTKQKPGFHAKNQKIWLPCQQNKTWFSKNLASMPQNLAFTPNKQKSASMPQNKIWLPCHKIFGFHATKPKLGFHATKIGSHAKNRLPCHKQNFGSHATKIRLSCHLKNQAFCHKIWLSCPKQPFDKRFSQNDNLLIKFSNKPFPFNFCLCFHQK